MSGSFIVLLVVLFICLSAVYSGSETGCYRLSRFSLRLGTEQKRPFYQMLSDVMKDSHGLMFSLIMGNNLVNYFATTLVTYLFLNQAGNVHMAEIYTTAIMTPTLFLFGDILPKNLFYHKANSFMTALAPLIWFSHKLFTLTGVVFVLKWLSNRLNRLFHTSIDTSQAVDLTQREQVKQIFHETREEGLVSELQKSMMDRLVRIPDLPVTSVMIPLGQVLMTELRTSRQQILSLAGQSPYTRILVYEESRQNIRGYVNVYKTLGCGRSFDSLADFVEPIGTIVAGSSVISALNQFRRLSHSIALVVSETAAQESNKEILGIVTLKDLMEEFTGELT